ncbi:transglutaminase family protein [Eubacterium sp. 1001713B170207_170306_E7]|uniref:transglutaminase-like domain-containing protein n=1 Tax=Eubacterium sp. 1001713B170207_170306_E7 TaxID=2787097 RepID=UPI00189B000D|nr:transglutaminase family protein [Eubacterium sp. 1001713B170207_170306_E7]
MKCIPESVNPEDYLKESRCVHYSDQAIKDKSESLYRLSESKLDYIEKVFLFVRDAIDHSWDIQSHRVTRTASEVLKSGEGICYAKSMLLAALLREKGIPAGFCYQRLTIGDTPDTGHCLHCLNGVYLEPQKQWIRLDARGNTFGKNAQFNKEHPEREQLAFPIRPEYGERDYPQIYVHPLPATIVALETNEDALDMILHGLPEDV